MKSIDQLFCSSPASTAICSSTVHHSVIPHGVRPIDRRRVHRLGHPPKTRTPAPCSSHLPFDPIPQYQKPRKSTSSSSAAAAKPGEPRRKSSADASDLQAAGATSPSGSSRYLLSNSPFIDFLSSDTNLARKTLARRQPSNELAVYRSPSTPPLESPVYKPPSLTYLDDSNVKSFPSTPSHRNHQVVELRVSIHCKGCEGKVRKHLSRMEGVTSFSIDLYTKKVTVIGDVTPVGVLASISKVKSAQFWPSPAAATSSSSSSSSPRVSLTN